MMETTKKQQVEGMFDAIAPKYDALNHVLSLGIDRWWRKKVVEAVDKAVDGGGRGETFRILDVATGTGDLAIALAHAIPTARVTGVDISENMLATGRKKISGRDRIELLAGDAEKLNFDDGTFDAVTVAFGVRNFGDIPRGLTEMGRVLRPGGRCVVLEFSVPTVPVFGWVFRVYFHKLLPWIGRVVSHDKAAYSYLPRSVDTFPAPGRFAEMMREAGFEEVRLRKMTFGVAAIFEGVKS
jgi:demethylmenaquinone methyltransferase/2-methoxy-6-polyprenyl-1,4-benzoquinol methylase